MRRAVITAYKYVWADQIKKSEIGPPIVAAVTRTLPEKKDRKIALALAALPEYAEDAALSIGVGLEQADLFSGGPLREPIERVAEAINVTGRKYIHVSACAAGTMALGHALRLIQRGKADRVIAGATDSMLNPLGLVGMQKLGAPSQRACRPFDRRRDGLLMGEGAAFFVVEEESKASGPILARILGYAATQDGYKVTAPRPDGARAAAAMRAALQDAGLSTVDYINAHGTGTPLNDVAESKAINAVVPGVPVSSIKGAIGHAMAAAGALEAAACVRAIETGIVPGTTGCEELDPECAVPVLLNDTPLRPKTILSNSFGFGGQNACIILGAP